MRIMVDVSDWWIQAALDYAIDGLEGWVGDLDEYDEAFTAMRAAKKDPEILEQIASMIMEEIMVSFEKYAKATINDEAIAEKIYRIVGLA